MADRDPQLGIARTLLAYDQDYGAWIANQAELLCIGRFAKLDLPNLVDEVESLGRSAFKTLVSTIEFVVIHTLKWAAHSARRSRSWINSIVEHHRRIEREVKDSPRYRVRLDDAVERAYETAPMQAARQIGLALRTFLQHIPYDWQAVVGREHVLEPDTGANIE